MTNSYIIHVAYLILFILYDGHVLILLLYYMKVLPWYCCYIIWCSCLDTVVILYDGPVLILLSYYMTVLAWYCCYTIWRSCLAQLKYHGNIFRVRGWISTRHPRNVCTHAILFNDIYLSTYVCIYLSVCLSVPLLVLKWILVKLWWNICIFCMTLFFFLIGQYTSEILNVEAFRL